MTLDLSPLIVSRILTRHSISVERGNIGRLVMAANVDLNPFCQEYCFSKTYKMLNSLR